jgi:hypothetical protein
MTYTVKWKRITGEEIVQFASNDIEVIIPQIDYLKACSDPVHIIVTLNKETVFEYARKGRYPHYEPWVDISVISEPTEIMTETPTRYLVCYTNDSVNCAKYIETTLHKEAMVAYNKLRTYPKIKEIFMYEIKALKVLHEGIDNSGTFCPVAFAHEQGRPRLEI